MKERIYNWGSLLNFCNLKNLNKKGGRVAMKRLLLIVLLISFSVLILVNIPNADTIITLEEFNNMWQRAQANIEINNPSGHSNIYTDTELIPEDLGLNFGWIEGVGVWGIEGFNWFGPGVMPVIQIGYYDEDAIYHPTGLHEETPRVEDENYTYYTLIAPPDTDIPPGTTFPSIGFYVPDDDL